VSKHIRDAASVVSQSSAAAVKPAPFETYNDVFGNLSHLSLST
jgi:hypothetical protein